MDNSSRNIVKFIATITIVALVIMAARYYAESQKDVAPPEAVETAATPVPEKSEAPVEANDDDPDADLRNPTGKIVEEDAQIVMGEPSVNLELGGSSIYPAQADSAPQPGDEPSPDTPVDQ